MHSLHSRFLSIKKILRTKRSHISVLAATVCIIASALGIRYFSHRPSPDYRKLSTEQLHVVVAHAPTPAAYLVLFQRVLNTNDKEGALKVAREMLHRYPTDARAHNNLGIAYASLGDAVNAKKAFHNAISLDPKRVDPYVNLGKLDLLLGDNQLALNEFDLATVVDPKSASAWTGLGEANVNLHNTVEATEALQRAIQLAPNRPKPYVLRGVYLSEMGNGDKARPDLAKALELGDQSASLYSGLAMAFADQPRSQDELSQALVYADKAIKLGNRSSLVYYAQGLALQRLGRYDEALSTFRTVIATSENANGAWTGISQCYRAQGKTQLADEAAKTAERVLSERQHISNLKHEILLAPNNMDLRIQYGDALSSNGQYLLAANEYRYAAMHSPNKPGLWLKTADAFEKGGETNLADYVRQFAHAKPGTLSGTQPVKSEAMGKPD